MERLRIYGDKAMTTQINATRISWIDMAKGYGILLVIFAHLDIASEIRTWIYSFHMPLFFFLSGYVFKEEYEPMIFLKKKVKSIVIPYVCLGIPMVLFQLLKDFFKGTLSLDNGVHLVRDFLLQRRLWTLWFIACLFCLNILFYIVRKLCKKEYILALFPLCLPILGLLYYGMGGSPMVWNADVCLMAIPFFYIGYGYKKYGRRVDGILENKGMSLGICVLLAVVNVLCGYLSLDASGVGLEMFDSQYGNPVFTYISAFAGIGCVVIISKWMLLSPIRYIGENSLLYYAWHQTIMIPLVVKGLRVVGIGVDELDGMVMIGKR